jgi:hypothetical protein
VWFISVGTAVVMARITASHCRYTQAPENQRVAILASLTFFHYPIYPIFNFGKIEEKLFK